MTIGVSGTESLNTGNNTVSDLSMKLHTNLAYSKHKHTSSTSLGETIVQLVKSVTKMHHLLREITLGLSMSQTDEWLVSHGLGIITDDALVHCQKYNQKLNIQ